MSHWTARARSSLATLTLLGLAVGVGGCALEAGQQASDSTETGIDPASCPGGAPHLVDGMPATWTVLHYAAADNNLDSVLVGDIDEMEFGHQGSPNVNVIVQLDRHRQDGRWRYRIEPDRTPETIGSPVLEFSEEEPDSGDWRTLSEFGRWGATCFPAQNYVVVIGGHGAGWSTSSDRSAPLPERAEHARARRHGESLRSIAPDNTNHSEIYVDELARALTEISKATRRPGDPDYLNRLVLYGSDACLMETMEVAYELRNAVTYLVGSEETEPAAGWPYNTLVRELTARPSYYAQRHHELAQMIVDVYADSYGPGGSAPDSTKATLAAVDTSATIKVRNRVDTIAGLLVDLIAVDAQLLGLVLQARQQSFTFGDDYTDLGLLLATLQQGLLAAGKMPAHGEEWQGDERWRTLRDTIDELLLEVWPDFVVANASGRYEGARGVSVFMPADACGWGMSTDDYAKAPFAADTRWGELAALTAHRTGLGDYQEAFGTGQISYQAFGQGYAADTRCDLYDGKLEVHVSNWHNSCPPEDDSCIDHVDLSFVMDVTHQSIASAHLWCRDLQIDTQLDGVDVVVTPTADWASGLYYDGSFQLSFPNGDGPANDVAVEFHCTEFVAEQCWDHW